MGESPIKEAVTPLPVNPKMPAALVGSLRYRPNPGNCEDRHLSILPDDGERSGAIGAVDGLRLYRELVLDEFAAKQRSS